MNLLNSNDADDVMKSRNIDKTFADVVDYGDIYRGVRKVVGKDDESAGTVVKLYTGESWLDTPLCDSFCQVAGTFVNCMTDRSDKDCWISNRIEQLIRSPKLRAGDSLPEVWHVFALYHRPSDKVFVSDVFVFDPRNGALLGVILGIQYQRVSKAALGKVLSRFTPDVKKSEPAGHSASAKLKTAAPPPPAKTSRLEKPPAPEKPLRPDLSDKVRILLANVFGVEPSEIKGSTGLVDIGIDSLMGMELAREIETVFKCTLDTSELMLLTDFESLIKCIQSALGLLGDDTSAGEDTPGEDSEDLTSPSDEEQTETEESAVNEPEDKKNTQAGGPSQASRMQVPSEAVEETPHVDWFSPPTLKEKLNDPMTTTLEAFVESDKDIRADDVATRQAVVDEYIKEYTQRFTASVPLNKVDS